MKINVIVKIHSREPGVLKNADGSYSVRVTAPAERGKANQAVRKLLAAYFDVSVSAVQIETGARSRKKIITIGSYVTNTPDASTSNRLMFDVEPLQT